MTSTKNLNIDMFKSRDRAVDWDTSRERWLCEERLKSHSHSA